MTYPVLAFELRQMTELLLVGVPSSSFSLSLSLPFKRSVNGILMCFVVNTCLRGVLGSWVCTFHIVGFFVLF